MLFHAGQEPAEKKKKPAAVRKPALKKEALLNHKLIVSADNGSSAPKGSEVDELYALQAQR